MKGFRVYLTMPGETIEMAKFTMRVPLSEVVKISIKPLLTKTSKHLRNYKPSERQCFFNFERRLHFYRLYTEHNCVAECLTNYTLQECQCAKFSMPSEYSSFIMVEFFTIFLLFRSKTNTDLWYEPTEMLQRCKKGKKSISKMMEESNVIRPR